MRGRGLRGSNLASVLLAVLALTGFAGTVAPRPAAASAGPVDRADTLVVSLLQDVDSLNPFVGSSASATMLFRLTYDYLTDYRREDNRPVPGLAESWTTSPDGLTWTFRIRDGVRWSDGRPLTAADVAFTFRTVMSHPTSANAALLRNVASVAAPDPATLVMRTKVPVPTMLALDIPVVPEHVWRGHDPLGEAPPGQAVSSGPFRVAEVRPAASYRLAPNAGHWRTPPRVGSLIFRYFTSGDGAVQALRKGEVDVVTNLTPAQFEALDGQRGIGRNVARWSRLTELGFNVGAARSDGAPIGDGHPALRDVRVRAAIEHAVDRKLLVSRVLGGMGDPGAGYLPPAHPPWGWQPAADQRRGFDPAAARRLLDAAGYRPGADGIRTGPDGRRLALRLYVPTGRAHYQQSATYLTAWLKAVGIEASAQLMSDADKADRIAAGRYDLFLGGWLYDPDPDYLLSVQTCGARPVAQGAGTTDTFACDAEFDRLYAAQSREVDRSRRVALVQQAQARLYETAPLLTLYYPAVLEAFREDRFTGYLRRPEPSGSLAGPWSYVAVTPVGNRPADAGSGSPARALGAGGLAVVTVAALTAWVIRRRATRELRE